MVNSKDFCKMYCNGKSIEIPINGVLKKEDLIILKEEKRKIYFSIVGNNPTNPKVALVGLCPGSSQLGTLINSYNKKGLSFEKSAQTSGFSKISKNLAKMLRKIGIDSYLKKDISDDFKFNEDADFLTTSLVKCASLSEGKSPSKQFNILKFDSTKLCFINRFIEDIKKYDSLKKIIILGKIGEYAVNEKLIDGKSVKQILEKMDKEVLFIPHPSGSNNGTIKKFLLDRY